MRRALVVLTAVLVLAGASCSAGGSDGSAAGGGRTTTSDVSSGGPATSGPLGSPTSPIADGIRIEVLSSQPDRISGDDARIRVTPPAGLAASGLRVTIDDRDVTAALPVADGHREGVVTGLIEGTNTLTAVVDGQRAVLRLRAWPRTGPVFSGPHLPLLACATEAAGLGRPQDADCSAPTQVTRRQVEDPEGGTITVRVERGVVNRSIYEIASVEPAPADHKLVYLFGGTCGTTFGQGQPAASAVDVRYLRRGYTVATASFNNFDVMCNDVLSAETASMVKERVIEELGPLRHTIGVGAGGGAAQVHLLTQNYPSILNGGAVDQPFPDWFSVWSGATDCGLLQHYYGTSAGRSLTPAQRTAINGHATDRTCARWAEGAVRAIDPTVGCDPAIPASAIYHPDTNRGGLRCTLQDANRNQVGVDAAGEVARPLDNVGVQYGLTAVQDGDITLDQFLDLNEAIGGYDIDGRIVAQREEAEPEVVLHAYETGRISMGGGDQALVPIIDVDTWDDPQGEVRDRLRPFSLRDRLTDGGEPEAAPGFQIWNREPGTDPLPDAVDALDEWLDALASAGGGPLGDVLRATRPDAALGGCEDACDDARPIAGDPRIAAGAPRSNQVLKCPLRPVDPTEYGVDVSVEQYERLRATFPQGVCDWSGESVGEVTPATPDRSYEEVPAPGQEA